MICINYSIDNGLCMANGNNCRGVECPYDMFEEGMFEEVKEMGNDDYFFDKDFDYE